MTQKQMNYKIVRDFTRWMNENASERAKNAYCRGMITFWEFLRETDRKHAEDHRMENTWA